MGFKENYPDLQNLVLEYLHVRKGNLLEERKSILANQTMDGQEKRLLLQQKEDLLSGIPADLPDSPSRHFSEGALVIITLERFLRLVLDRTGEANKGCTLFNLIEEGIGDAPKLLRYPDGSEPKKVKETISLLRNALLHANYEQIAADNQCASVREFFRTGYVPALEALNYFTQQLMTQIDHDTGKRYVIPPKVG